MAREEVTLQSDWDTTLYLGLAVETKDHKRVRWRSLYFHDPEGNEVELVCFDPSLGP